MKTKPLALLLLLPILLLSACKENTKPEPAPSTKSTQEMDAFDLRWGMTPAEVYAVYPVISDVLVGDGGIAGHVCGTVSLLGRDWELWAIAEEGGGLTAIKLEVETGSYDEAKEVYGQLRSLLNQKYGAAGRDVPNSHAIWGAPRTIIEIDLLSGGKVSLTYSARPGYADLDKL